MYTIALTFIHPSTLRLMQKHNTSKLTIHKQCCSEQEVLESHHDLHKHEINVDSLGEHPTEGREQEKVQEAGEQATRRLVVG